MLEELTPLAKICIELIDLGAINIDDSPEVVRGEVEEYYESLKGGENHD